MKSIPGRGTDLWKSPQAEMSLVFSKTGKEARVPRGQWEVVVHADPGWPWVTRPEVRVAGKSLETRLFP